MGGNVDQAVAAVVVAHIIGDAALPKTWLKRSAATYMMKEFAGPGALVLVAAPGYLASRRNVARARLLAARGFVVAVVAGRMDAPVAYAWALVSWAPDGSGDFRVTPAAAVTAQRIAFELRPPDRAAGGTSSDPGRHRQLPGRSARAGSGDPARARTMLVREAGRPRDQPPRPSGEPGHESGVPSSSRSSGGGRTHGRIAALLAGKGPAVAAYVDSYWSVHGTGPDWPTIAAELRWPGDKIDHARALSALAGAGWIDGFHPEGAMRVGRLWLQRDHRLGGRPRLAR